MKIIKWFVTPAIATFIVAAGIFFSNKDTVAKVENTQPNVPGNVTMNETKGLPLLLGCLRLPFDLDLIWRGFAFVV
jgi:hypothetical protein